MYLSPAQVTRQVKINELVKIAFCRMAVSICFKTPALTVSGWNRRKFESVFVLKK